MMDLLSIIQLKRIKFLLTRDAGPELMLSEKLDKDSLSPINE